MKIFSIICLSFLFFNGFSYGKVEEEKSVISPYNENTIEFYFSFPSFLDESFVRKYVDVVKRRIEFIYGRDVSINFKKDEVIFSFLKNDLKVEDIDILYIELFKNFELKFYDVYDAETFSVNSDFSFKIIDMEYSIEYDKTPKLAAVSNKAFLTFYSEDISEFELDTMNTDGEQTPVLRITLKNKIDILEKRSEEVSKKRGMFYYQFNEYPSGVVNVSSKISNQFSMKLVSDYPLKILEMQYRYPLPQNSSGVKVSKK